MIRGSWCPRPVSPRPSPRSGTLTTNLTNLTNQRISEAVSEQSWISVSWKPPPFSFYSTIHATTLDHASYLTRSPSFSSPIREIRVIRGSWCPRLVSPRPSPRSGTLTTNLTNLTNQTTSEAVSEQSSMSVSWKPPPFSFYSTIHATTLDHASYLTRSPSFSSPVREIRVIRGSWCPRLVSPRVEIVRSGQRTMRSYSTLPCDPKFTRRPRRYPVAFR